MFKRVIIYAIMFSGILLAQNGRFETHTTTLNGELTAEDIFETDFGRFDAYELQMEDGDFIIMKLKADFFPLLTIVSPSNDYKIAFPTESQPEVVFQQNIEESGLYQIYIAGDSTDFGKHYLKLYYVSENTRKLPPNSDYCTLVDFFLAHSKTDFFYFRNENGKIKTFNNDLKIDLQKLFDKGEVSTKDNVSKVILYSANNEMGYDVISKALKMCLKNNWNVREKNNSLEFKEIEGLRRIFLEKENKVTKLSILTK